eukprot:gene3170-3969_t
MNTRICVKQLPKHLTEKRFNEHFSKFGEVTDCKIIRTKEGKSRLFGFIGYSTNQSAKNALSLNGTYLDTSKISVELATVASDPGTARPWSKYSEGSSSNKRLQKSEKEEEDRAYLKRKQREEEEKERDSKKKKESEMMNDPEYLKFKNLMAPRNQKQLWADDNDQNKDDDDDDEDGSSKKKKKISDSYQQNHDLQIFQDSDDEDDNLYDEMPVQSKEEEDEEELTKKDPVVNDSSVSDLDWLKSKVSTNADKEEEENEDSEENSSDNDSDSDCDSKSEGENSSSDNDSENSEDEKDKENDSNQSDDDEEMKDSKEDKKEEVKFFEDDYKRDDDYEEVGESGRLFIRNLPYSAKEEDLQNIFQNYGKISEIYMPIDINTKKPKGFAYILYMVPENAVRAMNEMDKKIFQGRIIHILPAKKIPKSARAGKEDDPSNESNYKQTKEREMKATSGNSFNWNSLFMRSDAVVSSLAERYKMTQGQLLDHTSTDLAVRVTLMETHIINETKKFLEAEGVIIDTIGNKDVQRSNNVILVKNIPFSTKESELEELFMKYGELGRVLLTPARTLALIEYLHPTEAKQGFKNLAYTKFHHVPLFLEWAPTGIFKNPTPASRKQQEQQQKDEKEKEKSTTEKEKESEKEKEKDSSKQLDPSQSYYVFVKNLNWSTTVETLRDRFKTQKDFVNVNIATKPNPKVKGETLSCGYGFIQFSSKFGAHETIRKLNRSTIDGHEIQLKISDKNEVTPTSQKDKDNNKNNKKETTSNNNKDNDKVSTKLNVKNIAFEATSKEIRKLFGTYGEISSVRLPQKPNGGHRGFGFVEFLTEQEAKNAKQALDNSHFYGRHLVIQYAEQDKNIDQLRERANLDYEKLKKNKF